MASRGRLRSQLGVAVKLRPKTQGRPCKISPAASRFLYSRPPLRDSTPVMRDSKSKAKPSEGTPEGPVDRGSAADYFGASPVASALNLPRERDSPKNRKQTTTHSSPARSKPDISTLQGIGHFYFALTTCWRQLVDTTCRRNHIERYCTGDESRYPPAAHPRRRRFRRSSVCAEQRCRRRAPSTSRHFPEAVPEGPF